MIQPIYCPSIVEVTEKNNTQQRKYNKAVKEKFGWAFRFLTALCFRIIYCRVCIDLQL